MNTSVVSDMDSAVDSGWIFSRAGGFCDGIIMEIFPRELCPQKIREIREAKKSTKYSRPLVSVCAEKSIKVFMALFLACAKKTIKVFMALFLAWNSTLPGRPI